MQDVIDCNSSDDESVFGLDDDDPSIMLWPIFYGNELPPSTLPTPRILKSGRIGYKKPIENPDPSFRKLIPAKIPRQTKHDRKKTHDKAIGKENNIMEKFLIKKNPPSVAQNVIDPNLSLATLDNPHQPNLLDSLGATEIRLNNQLEKYLSAPRVIEPQVKRLERAQAQWTILNSSLNIVISECQAKKKKDASFDYPYSTIANLQEFNNLRREYTLKGIKSPTNAESLSTAQSSLRRLPTLAEKPSEARSGIYLARLIAKQARHVVDHKELFRKKRGNHKAHSSILDNLEL